MWYHKYGGVLEHHHIRWQKIRAPPWLVSLYWWPYRAVPSILLPGISRKTHLKSTAALVMPDLLNTLWHRLNMIRETMAVQVAQESNTYWF